MDKYILGQSKIGGVSEKQREVVLNLSLKKNSYYNNLLVYGNIMDSDKNPIKEARISFFDEDDEKIDTVYSSNEGFYVSFKVKLNTKIKMLVKRSGFKSKVKYFRERCSKIFNLNIYLEKLSTSKSALISGHLVDCDNSPLEGVDVYLLKNTCPTETKLYKVTITNKYGQFVFSSIEKGKYKIFINNPKFELYDKLIEIKESDEIFDINIKLNKKDKKTKITGQIRDETDNPIPNAIVILYKVGDNDKLISITHTICDKKGFYSFSNIPFANYLIKAKL